MIPIQFTVLILFSVLIQKITNNENTKNLTHLNNVETFRDDTLLSNKDDNTIQTDLINETHTTYNPDKNVTKVPICGTSCHWRKKGLINNDHKINYKELEKLVNYAVRIAIDDSNVPLINTEFLTTKLISECNETHGRTHGEKAVKMRNCLFGKLMKQRNTVANWEDFEDLPYLDIEEEECLNQLNLDGPTIENINRHYIVPENNTEFQQFLSCYWKRDNIMDDNGNFNITVLYLRIEDIIKYEILARSRLIYLSDIITTSIMDDCQKIKDGGNPEELIFQIKNYVLRRVPYFEFVI